MRLFAVVLAVVVASPVAAKPKTPSLRQYMPIKVFHWAHPKGPDLIYHDANHSRYVQRIAYSFAIARGLSHKDAKFLGEVALLHDWDPNRKAGTPARVKETIKILRRDYFGRTPLYPGFKGTSVLIERFGWNPQKLNKAIAIIQRTEFPFSADNKAYKKKSSPVRRYDKMLARLAPEDRAFVLEEAPIMSEYADKLSTYVIKNTAGATDTVQGLANEITTIEGKTQSVRELKPYEFLSDIGSKAAFKHDARLARKYEVENFELPTRKQFFAAMPSSYKHNYRTTRKFFKPMSRALRAAKRQKHRFVKTIGRVLLKQQRFKINSRPAWKSPSQRHQGRR